MPRSVEPRASAATVDATRDDKAALHSPESMMFALWRTCQHFSTPHSLPDATSVTMETLLAAAPDLPAVGRAQQYAARETEKGWSGIGFVKHGAVRTTTPAQLTTYDLCRMGLKPFSNDNYRPLTPSDHPQRTVDLDL